MYRKKIGFVVLLVFLCVVITTIFRAWLGLMVGDVVLSLILFCGVVGFLIRIKKYPAGFTLLYALLTLFFLEILAVAIDGMYSLFGLPNMLSAYLGMVCGYLLGNKKTPGYIAFGITFLLLCASVWYVQIGFRYWTNYVYNNSFTGQMKKSLQHHDWFLYSDTNGDTIMPEQLNGRIAVFDFWTTSCSACRKQFPEFEQLYLRYQSDTNFYFKVINIPTASRNQERQSAIIRETQTDYKFPMVTGSDSLVTAFDITGYPVYVVLVQDTIRFKTSHLSQLDQFLREIHKP